MLLVALVNNMPDSAFEETRRQFAGLLARAASRAGIGLAVTPVAFDGVPRGPMVAETIRRGYAPVSLLWRDPPDAVVVSGAEPVADRVAAEPCYPELAALVERARRAGAPAMLSCLAAHGALHHLDGIERRPLATKRFGVFPQRVLDDPLAAGLGGVSERRGREACAGFPGTERPSGDASGAEPGSRSDCKEPSVETVRLPHSRSNDVPTACIREAGWRPVLVSSDPAPGWPASGWPASGWLPHPAGADAGGDWGVAVRRVEGWSVTLLQGHPEYGATTLLREYRRDVRRFLRGQRGTYPELPAGSLSGADVEALERFRATADGPAAMARFPFEPIAAGLHASWRAGAEVLFANWLREVAAATRRRAGIAAGGPAHATKEG